MFWREKICSRTHFIAVIVYPWKSSSFFIYPPSRVIMFWFAKTFCFHFFFVLLVKLQQWAAIQKHSSITFFIWRNRITNYSVVHEGKTRSHRRVIKFAHTHEHQSSYFPIIYTLTADKYIQYMKIRFRFQAYTIFQFDMEGKSSPLTLDCLLLFPFSLLLLSLTLSRHSASFTR